MLDSYPFRDIRSFETITLGIGEPSSVFYFMQLNGQVYHLDNLGEEPVAELEDLYRQGNAWVKENDSALEKSQNGIGQIARRRQ